jgi:transcriptional regulator with XRE-family HTH domain
MTYLSDEQIYLIIGRKIKETRTRLGITQTELAKKIEMVRTSLTNIESGEQKLPIHVLYKIAGVLKVPIIDLLPEIEEEEIDIAALLNQKKVVDKQGQAIALEDHEKAKILKLIMLQRRESDDQES